MSNGECDTFGETEMREFAPCSWKRLNHAGYLLYNVDLSIGAYYNHRRRSSSRIYGTSWSCVTLPPWTHCCGGRHIWWASFSGTVYISRVSKSEYRTLLPHSCSL